MTGLALALVLASAITHATWNLLAKRAGGGLTFTWLSLAISIVLQIPLVLTLIAVQRPAVGAVELTFMLGSALLHLVYFWLLGQGYRFGDLSLVYPLARGTGPLLASAAAIAFFGERPSGLAIAGALLIGVGVVLLTGDPRELRKSGSGRAVGYALLNGVVIAGYTLWDKQAVSAAAIPPLLYFWGFSVGCVAIALPWAIPHRSEIRAVWLAHRTEALWAAVLVPVSYILALTALATSPVSYVAPAREISILFGAAMGSHLLAEGQGPRRLLAAAAMVLGVIALAVG
jgi:drug/metabolite transporter (DMT)-like permease